MGPLQHRQPPGKLDPAPIQLDRSESRGKKTTIDNREEEVKSMNLDKKTTNKKKMMIFRLPQEELDYYLTFQVRPIWQSLALRDPSTAAKVEAINQRILIEQEKMRQEYEAKGYVTFEAEVTDDDEEVEDAAALCVTAQEEEKNYEAAAPWIPQGRGRRRFRPRVVKQAGRVKKIII
ncbi:hypothetical protein TRIUR3_07199 [Triticum urartu]|uniref:Uncharacterized protein n=1 Tax=Triticum urartu TaxID=4572 RepID=M7YTX9_TRIUA|nr:hypothetical protein TRIUR3_07199 [Triticum urartu]